MSVTLTTNFYKSFTNSADVLGRIYVGYTTSDKIYYGFAFLIEPSAWKKYPGQYNSITFKLNLYPWDRVGIGDRINLKITNDGEYVVNNTAGYIPDEQASASYVFQENYSTNAITPVSVNFTINFNQLTSLDLTKNVYVYIGSPGLSYGYLITRYHINETDWYENTVTAELDYTAVTAPAAVTNFRITSSNKIYKDGSITLAWNKSANGVNNALSGYKIYYNSTSLIDNSKVISLDANVTSYKISNSILNIIRGKKGYLAIQAIGTDDRPDSTVSNFISYQVVDKPPDSPIYTVTGILSSTGNGAIKITNLSSNDIDGDTITYYYNINDASSASKDNPISEGETILIENLPNAKISIWAYANERFSNNPTTKTITTNIKPNIQEVVVKTQDIPTYGGYLCTNTITAQAILNKVLDSGYYTWTISTIDEEGKTSATQTIQGVSKLTNQVLNLSESQKIVIDLSVVDPLEDEGFSVGLSQQLNVYTMTKKSLRASSFSIQRADDAESSDDYPLDSKYINKKFKAAVTFPIIGDFDVPIKEVRIRSRTTKDTEIRTHKVISFSSGQNIEASFISDVFNYESIYNFYVEMIDNAGRMSHTFHMNENNTGEKKGFSRLPKIDITGEPGSQSESYIIPLKWQPLSPDSRYSNFSISTRKLVDEETVGKGIPKYKVYVSVDDGKTYRYLCSSVFYANTDSKDHYIHTWSGAVFNNSGLATNVADYQAIYQIAVVNAFGVEGERITISGNYIITTQELPYFLETELIIRIKYIPGDGTSDYKELALPDETKKSTYIFNPGEILNFTIKSNNGSDPRAIDPNGEAVGGYRIQWSVDKNEWDTFYEFNDFVQVNESNYQVDCIVPANLTTKNSVYFRILPIDKTTGRLNGSSYIANDNQFHYGRKAGIEGSVAISAISSTVNCKLSITDFGGDNKGLANFNRGQDVESTDYKPVTITIDYSKNSSFADSKRITWTSSSYPTSNTISFSNSTFDSSYLDDGKVYFKTTLTLNTNYYDTTYNQIIKTFPISIFYTDAPTVAYRAHHVGVNCNEFEEGDVMVISQFDTRKKIRLIGEYSVIKDDVQTTEVRSIDIDLSTGSISEAVIDCGSWSS